MTRSFKTTAALAITLVLAGAGGSIAQTQSAYHRRHAAVVADAGDRPLTIGRAHHGHGLIYRGNNEIYAPGGFEAQGYGRMYTSPEARHEAQMADLRSRTNGLYGYGFDGVGGNGIGDDSEIGYDNSNYGAPFSVYEGYNGVPTNLAFGPGFANRRIADQEPEDRPAPSPARLGYVPNIAPAPTTDDDDDN